VNRLVALALWLQVVERLVHLTADDSPHAAANRLIGF
jgi:hypothetical protein